MNAGELIGLIERFFLDIIGMIIPGYLFIIGLWILLGQPVVFNTNAITPFDPASNDLFLLVVAYILGYAISSVGENIFLFTIEHISVVLRGKEDRRITARFVPKNVRPYGEIMEQITTLESYRGFVHKAKELYPWLDQPQKSPDTEARAQVNTPSLFASPPHRHDVRRWRNVALTIVGGSNYVVYRFMFISLLNLGIATALVLFAILWPILHVANSMQILEIPSVLNMEIAGSVLLLILSLPFIERRYSFYRRAQTVPFDIAVIKLKEIETSTKSGAQS